MKGSCQCGGVKYQINAESIALVFCYCTDCQKLSAGIGSYSMLVTADNFEVLSGDFSSYERVGNKGVRNLAHFCTDCGNRIYALNPESPGIVRVKAGTIDNARALDPDAYVWMQSAPEWVRLPEGVLAYDTQPTLEEGLKAIQERRQYLTKRNCLNIQ